ncbi:hypothetical protein Tco_0671812 [Tanacetum coccineum]
MADLIQNNLALEERLDKHRTRLYNLENLNIPKKVSKSVDEIVTDAVNWAMQDPLQACFSDLPAVDMKEVLQQRMYEDKSYEAHEDHKNLKKRKRHGSPRTPFGSPSLPSPPPPPPTGASGAPGTSGASRSSQMPPPPPPLSTETNQGKQQRGSRAPSSVSADQKSSPTDSMMNKDFIPDEQVQSSDDEDTTNDQLPKADTRKDWWKPLPEEERPATPKPAWIIPSSNMSDVENNWASLLATTYEPPAENSLLAKTGDMTTFMNWYCRQFQMEECHKMFTDQVDWTNPEGDQGSSPALSISKMKATRYPDFGLELLVPKQVWIDDVCSYDISAKYEARTHMRILSVVRIKAYSRYGYDYLSEIVLRKADYQEHTIAEKDFKNQYPSDFEDMNLILLQGHLDHLPGSDKRMLSIVVKLGTRNLVIRQRVEYFQLGIESYQTQLNLTKPE